MHLFFYGWKSQKQIKQGLEKGVAALAGDYIIAAENIDDILEDLGEAFDTRTLCS